MGKSSKPVIGYWHKMTLYMGECHGPADALRAVEWGGEMAWQGNQTTSGSIVINKPNLFGGEKKEGGIVGTMYVRMGETDQMPHLLLTAMRPGPWPAARGLVTTVWDGDVSALTPYVKPLRKLWSRWTQGWNTTGPWQPDLCKVGEGMNGAHIMYNVLTDSDWGFGASPAEIIDEPSFLACAQTLFNEQFGLCLGWKRSTAVGSFLDIVCEHIGGQWGVLNDKVILTLFRADYDVDDLPLLDPSNIIDLESWEQPLLDGSVNEVTVVGKDALTGKDVTRTYQNLANVQAQGRVVSEKRQLPGLWNTDLIGRVAARECLAKSMLPARVNVVVKGSAGPFYRGQVLALRWPRRGVDKMPVRVMEVDEGTVTDTSIRLTLLQDVNGMQAASYISPDGSGWEAPDTAPHPLNPQAIYEATYRDLVASMRPADLAMVADTSGYLVTTGGRPSGAAYNYVLKTRVGSAAYAEVATGDFTPHAVLADAMPRAETNVTVNLLFAQDLDLVQVGEEVIVGTEHGRVVAINAVAGTLTMARGCLDTVPAEQPPGTRLWFPDQFNGADPTEYLVGETVNAKLLTRTSAGPLDEASATALSLAIAARQNKPYPPARLRVNGDAYPASVAGSITVTWVHRDRLLQGDQLVDASQSGIGPEPGTTYTVRWYNAASSVLSTESGITGTSSSSWLPPVAGTYRVTVEAVRDGIGSWQRAEHVFDWAPLLEPGWLAFEPTGIEEAFEVPSGITSITAHAIGAAGGGGIYSNGGGNSGAGGYSVGTFAVTPGETLRIRVGVGGQGGRKAASGAYGGAGGYPGGGSGSFGDTWGGGGGGYSGVFRNDGTPLLIAGGGGGGTGYTTHAGAGGGASGGNGSGCGGGTASAGGTGTYPGSAYQGGNANGGNRTTTTSQDCGGGGGGYFGGGAPSGDGQTGAGGSGLLGGGVSGNTYSGTNATRPAAITVSIGGVPTGSLGAGIPGTDRTPTTVTAANGNGGGVWLHLIS